MLKDMNILMENEITLWKMWMFLNYLEVKFSLKKY